MNIFGCLDVADQGVYDLVGNEVTMLKNAQISEIRNQKIGFVYQNLTYFQD
jgi:putative ABC transport system ATP-binding protein